MVSSEDLFCSSTPPTGVERRKNTACDANTRFDRIETKLDHIGQTLITLVRLEERMGAMDKEHIHTSNTVSELSKKVAELDIRSAESAGKIGAFVKGFWTVLTALTGIFLMWLFSINAK